MPIKFLGLLNSSLFSFSENEAVFVLYFWFAGQILQKKNRFNTYLTNVKGNLAGTVLIAKYLHSRCATLFSEL